ncbi:MAG TPA: DUF4160 domain-containing protein [Pirellulaceae bacterium]|nr:DUF4160 domain-containing protein [Pirellulaceae bacterium]
MPELSRFHGIIIRMFYEAGLPHHRPHFHAYYQDDVVSIAIDTMEVLAGSLPRRQQRLVEAWAELHQVELQAAWQAIVEEEPVTRIEPLR